MAGIAENKGIVDSWSLMDFARSHGKMQVGDFVAKETGEQFKSCIFTGNSGSRIFVHFSSKMGYLTPQQIANQKDKLQVVKLESGSYILCAQGENNWADVDLGL